MRLPHVADSVVTTRGLEVVLRRVVRCCVRQFRTPTSSKRHSTAVTVFSSQHELSEVGS